MDPNYWMGNYNYVISTLAQINTHKSGNAILPVYLPGSLVGTRQAEAYFSPYSTRSHCGGWSAPFSPPSFPGRNPRLTADSTTQCGLRSQDGHPRYATHSPSAFYRAAVLPSRTRATHAEPQTPRRHGRLPWNPTWRVWSGILHPQEHLYAGCTPTSCTRASEAV